MLSPAPATATPPRQSRREVMGGIAGAGPDTGKGGVGKSTVTAATALLAAEQGQRVLVVEADDKGAIPGNFEQPSVGFEPREVYPGVCAMAMRTEDSLKEYLKLNLRVPVLGRLGPLARVLDFVATAAPGVKELLTVGKVC